MEVPAGFPAAALAEAEAAAGGAPGGAGGAASRADLRDVPFLTIDPPGSMDLDQALCLERASADDGEGAAFVVHYAIADVGAFVVPGGALDAEVHERGTTLYAPDGRTPLHPAVLSEGAASLLPGEERPAAACRSRSRSRRSSRTTTARSASRSARRSRRMRGTRRSRSSPASPRRGSCAPGAP